MTLRIYSYPGNPRVQKILIAAKYNGIEIETPEFDIGCIKSKEFLEKNPMGKVPVLETDKGFIFESGAILRYVARLSPSVGLYGSSFYEAALVDQWIDFATCEFDNVTGPWVYPVVFPQWFSNDAAAVEKAKASLAKSLTSLNDYLQNHTFLVGERLTVADIAVAGSLLMVTQTVMDAKFRKPYGNVWRWFNTCVNQENFKAVVGNVAMVDEAYTPKK